MIERGLVEAGRDDEIRRVAQRFSVALSEYMAALIDPADRHDPIAAQFVPTAKELDAAAEERADPIGDERWSPLPGVVHRYPDRALLKPTLICPVYCRFCFRREHVGPEGGVLSETELDAAYAWLAERPAIQEVILTGGDPLMLSPRRLGGIVGALSAIAHVRTIRVHTRRPVAD